MTEAFSQRQLILLGRLDSVCKRIESEVLPIIVEEVWIFGSFLRSKENPRDIDVVIKCSENPDFPKFRELMTATYPKRHEFPTPKDAFLHIAGTSVKGENPSVSLMAKWLDGYTWNMIFSGPMGMPEYVIDRVPMTKRILLQDISGIQISQIVPTGDDLSYLRAEILGLAWDRRHRDLFENVRMLLAPPKVREVRLKDLENFEKQEYGLKKEIEIIHSLFSKMRSKKIRLKGYNEAKDWLEEKTASSFPELPQDTVETIVSNIYAAYPTEYSLSKEFDSKQYAELQGNELSELVETKRAGLKPLQAELVVLRNLIHFIVNRLSAEPNEWLARYSTEEWLAMDCLNYIPKRLVKEEQIRKVLQKLGLPEGKVLVQKDRQVNKYTIPENDKKERNIKLRNSVHDLQSKYRKIANPVIRKVSKSFGVYIETDQNHHPTALVINYFLNNTDGAELPDEEQKVLGWCKSRNFIIRTDKHYTEARLSIRIEDWNDLRQAKERILSVIKGGLQ